MPSELSAREAEVVEAMRASPRAERAIYNYATTFAGDEQALTPASFSDEYGDAYD